MNIKRTLTIIIAFLIVFSLTACQEKNDIETTAESSNNNVTEAVSDIVSDKTLINTTTLNTSAYETEANTTENASDNPAKWTTEQIVDFYKTAAKKSNAAAKSEQSILLKNISVNNGEYEGLFEFITPIMSKLLANNSEEKDGITGGYGNLAASDAASARAYKSGDNIAVEMIMKEQTSGARDDALNGSVGHAITAVGDIGVVIKQLKDLGLPLEISENDTKIYYTNPTVKVLINSSGEIIKGTWRYTVDISMNNYKAFGKKVDTTSVVMDNIITVNGGF